MDILQDPNSQKSQWAAKITDTENAKNDTLIEVPKALEVKAERLDEDQGKSTLPHQFLTNQVQHVFGSAGV